MTVNAAESSISKDWVVVPPFPSALSQESSLGIFYDILEDAKVQKDLFPPPSLYNNHQFLIPAYNVTLTKAANQFSTSISEGIHRRWGNELLDEKTCFQKMEKNLVKAYEEHITQYEKFITKKNLSSDNFPNPYADPSEWINILESTEDVASKIVLTHGCSDARGVRPTMEDAKFVLDLKDGLLVGVFDGHGGSEVADIASREFQMLFPQQLSKFGGNVHQAFEKVFFEIQKKITLDRRFDEIGSTAVVSYIDAKNQLIYTATIGDSEAFICRRDIQDEFKLIPLSCVRDWASDKDIQRAAKATQGQYEVPVEIFWQTNNVPPKHRRIDQTSTTLLKNDNHGVNVSRAFGDQIKNVGRPTDAIIAKPKITVCSIKKSDVFLFFCDGVTDYVKDKNALIDCVRKYYRSPTRISFNLVDLAFACHTTDNVSVVVVKVEN